ncbi:hypothetical protein EJ04DRAFT_2285 [Polyplosphaeria fusca]|uniref:Uncharacterized protein n=1 Tax=Polyplosphaeria fusca TaxID=682080 RepID=A0A9P4RCX3_9PLEO|nr:hypothetical protein EJ04DRAFT_2285 [Polyplosphaeria fusca]
MMAGAPSCMGWLRIAALHPHLRASLDPRPLLVPVAPSSPRASTRPLRRKRRWSCGYASAGSAQLLPNATAPALLGDGRERVRVCRWGGVALGPHSVYISTLPSDPTVSRQSQHAVSPSSNSGPSSHCPTVPRSHGPRRPRMSTWSCSTAAIRKGPFPTPASYRGTLQRRLSITARPWPAFRREPPPRASPRRLLRPSIPDPGAVACVEVRSIATLSLHPIRSRPSRWRNLMRDENPPPHRLPTTALENRVPFCWILYISRLPIPCT